MLKQIYVAQCDLCGKIESAKQTFFRNEYEYSLPDGWSKSAVNANVCLCPACKMKFDLGYQPLRSANE